MKRYRSEERALKRLSVLQRHGYWPAVIHKWDDAGEYWELSYDPDVYELAA